MKSDIPVYDLRTISEYRQEDILISRLAPYVENHKDLLFPHRHNFFHIVLFTEGSGTHAIDFQNFPVKAYQIYFMSPGQVHDWNFEGPVNGYVINFSNSFFQSFLLRPDFLENFPFFDGSINHSVLDIPKEYRTQIMELFEELLQEESGNKKYSANMVRVLLLKIFILISRFSIQEDKSAISSSYNYTLLKNFQQLIERNYTTLRLPKDYAELLYITPNHLNALCNDMLGISAGEVIRMRIILEAKRLLINLDLSISEISNQLNFNDNSYFSKFFKKQVGLTPEEFRKKNIKKRSK